MEQVSNSARNQLQESKKQFSSLENSDGASLVKLPKMLKGSKQQDGKLHSKGASLLDFPVEELKIATPGEKISFDALLKPVEKKPAKAKVKDDIDSLWDVSVKIVEPTVSFPLIPIKFETINLQLELGGGFRPAEGKKDDVATDTELPIVITAKDSSTPKLSLSLKVNKPFIMPNKALPGPNKIMDVVVNVPNVKAPGPVVSKSLGDLSLKTETQDLYDNKADFVSFIDLAEEENLPQITDLPLDVNNKDQNFLASASVKQVKKLSEPEKHAVKPVNKLIEKTAIALKNGAYIDLKAKTEAEPIVAPASVSGPEPVVEKQAITPNSDQHAQEQIIRTADVKLQSAPASTKIQAIPLQTKKANGSAKINSQIVEQKPHMQSAAKQVEIISLKAPLVNKVDFNVGHAAEPMQNSLKSLSKELTRPFKADAPIKNIEDEEEQTDIKPVRSVMTPSAQAAKKTTADVPLAHPIAHRSKHLSFTEGRPLNFGSVVEKSDSVNVVDKPIGNFSALVGVEVTNVRKQGNLQQIDLVLKPEHLGRLVAKLRLVDKQMLVEIQAPNKDTAKTLLLNENLLKDAIKNAGLSHKHEITLIISDKTGAANILHVKRNEGLATTPTINHNGGSDSFLGGNSDAPNSERKKFKKKSKDIDLDLSVAPKRDFGGNNIEKVLSNNPDNLLII